MVRRAGFDLFMFDYRGFGWSTGRIGSEQQLNADVRAAWDFIAPWYRERSLPIVIYGRSLGSGLAVPLAREVDPEMLILATPFTSLAVLTYLTGTKLPKNRLTNCRITVGSLYYRFLNHGPTKL